jgi:hypothetical protein
MSPIGFSPIRFGNDAVEKFRKQLQQQAEKQPQAKPNKPIDAKPGDTIEWSHTNDKAGIDAVRKALQKDEG